LEDGVGGGEGGGGGVGFGDIFFTGDKSAFCGTTNFVADDGFLGVNNSFVLAGVRDCIGFGGAAAVAVFVKAAVVAVVLGDGTGFVVISGGGTVLAGGIVVVGGGGGGGVVAGVFVAAEDVGSALVPRARCNSRRPLEMRRCRSARSN